MRKKILLAGILFCTLSCLLSGPALAKMGGFGGGGMGSFGAKKKEKKRAKLQDVLWDKKTEGQVRIFCSPAAKLYIDGNLKKDPNNRKQFSEKYAAAMKAGKHVIEMRRDGYITEKKEMIIEAGKPYSVNFTLMKKGQKVGGMVLVPAGEFIMGLSKGDTKWIRQKIGAEERFFRNQLPRHKVKVSAFYIDKYEVTNAQYKKFVDATGRTPPEDWKNGTYPGGKANHPVVFVTWHDAEAYAKWAGKRLPTEEEWEKAARGPRSSLYPWGDAFRRNKVNTETGGPGRTTPVGTYEKGKTHYGAYDMSGNVKEWTADFYKDYPGNPFKDEFFGLTEPKVARGGSFLEANYDCMGSTRFKITPTVGDEDLGFRCVKDAGSSTAKEIDD